MSMHNMSRNFLNIQAGDSCHLEPSMTRLGKACSKQLLLVFELLTYPCTRQTSCMDLELV